MIYIFHFIILCFFWVVVYPCQFNIVHEQTTYSPYIFHAYPSKITRFSIINVEQVNILESIWWCQSCQKFWFIWNWIMWYMRIKWGKKHHLKCICSTSIVQFVQYNCLTIYFQLRDFNTWRKLADTMNGWTIDRKRWVWNFKCTDKSERLFQRETMHIYTHC